MRWASTATAAAWSEDSARTVDVPFTKLDTIVRPKGGNCGIVIAAPGVGKTTFLLNWAVKSGMNTLYLSADTSPHDLTAQLASLATGHLRAEVEPRLMSDQTWREQYASAIFQKFPNLVVDFTQRPSMLGIRRKATALTELWGEAPQMVVMDTASNVEMEDMGANAEWQRVWLESINIARDLNTFFVFAHHVRQGLARSGRTAPDLNDGLWGCDQFPEFVFGLHNSGAREVTCTVRKNRGGPKDVPVKLPVDLSRALFEKGD